MSEPNRREFIESAAVLGAVSVLGMEGQADAAQAEVTPRPEMARLLTEALRARHGKALDETVYKNIRQKIQNQLASADVLKSMTIRNADEPDFVFQAELP